jgi:phosphoribosylformylglycinamidine cyclo-ligase
MPGEKSPISYSSIVDYGDLDPFKVAAQEQATTTSSNIIERTGFSPVERSRGESAFVVDEGDRYSAHVIEGLGTKNLVADEARKIRIAGQIDIAGHMGDVTGRTYYDGIAKDTVAMIVNDLITVGADPHVVNAYCAVGDAAWFKDARRAEDIARGWKQACDEAGAVWGGGETPALAGIINPETIDLAGSAYGTINPKRRLTLGDRLEPGNTIMLIDSSGIHANGLSMARKIAEKIATETESKLSDAYATQLSDGTMYGEALLEPTHIYAGLVRDLFNQGIDIRYMSNITGHGWRKLMRYKERPFTYRMTQVPKPQAVFEFMQEESGNDDQEMYGNLNMGAGFAIFINPKDARAVEEIAFARHNVNALKAGVVEEGPRQVIIEPKNLTFAADTLGVR